MTSTTKLITCQRSGLPLLEVTTLCSNGWALISQPMMTTFIHPIYNATLDKLCRKLELQLIELDTVEWNVPATSIREVALTMSAMMYSLGAMWLPNSDNITHGRNIECSLPDVKTTVGCASRLLALAYWYHFETSKRITFPLWKPSKSAGNLNWHGFPAWLDACFDLKEEWESAKRKKENKELLDSTEMALATVHMATVYKRIDINKVWNWIELQAADHADQYPLGRRATLKTLFTEGDQAPEDWLPDDCDDLMEMVTTCCDLGNDITHYIRNRMSIIRGVIANFYKDFTILGGTVGNAGSGGLDLSDTEQTAQDALFKEFDDKLLGLTELPPAPNPANYTSKIALMRANAEYSILTKRFAAKQAAI